MSIVFKIKHNNAKKNIYGNVMKKILLILLFVISNISCLYSFETKAKEAILIDFDTGEILFKKNEKNRVFPSSMTKIMTAYIVFEKINSGQLSLNEKLLVSKNAWKKEGSRMFLKVGSKVKVEDLLKGLIIQSGNDAACVLAEGIAGSEYEFVKLMNEKANTFGLKNTNYTNVIGYSEQEHYMSVEDTAILSRRLIKDFPDFYKKYFHIPVYTYNKIRQVSKNELLGKYDGIDGIKTGHTELGGYAISTSAIRNNRRLISVVNSLNTKQERKEETISLLNYGFLVLNKFVFFEKNQTITSINVLFGKKKQIDLISNQDIVATSRHKEDINVSINVPKTIKAPIVKGQKIGTITLTTEYDELSFDLLANEDVKKSNIFIRIFQYILYIFKHIF